MQVRKDCIWAFFVFRHTQQVVGGHAIELSQRCHGINAEVGHIVALVFRQRRFGQTRLLCQRFQLQMPLHTQVFEPFSQCQLDVHGRTSDRSVPKPLTKGEILSFLSIEVLNELHFFS